MSAAHTPGPWFVVAGNQVRSDRHQIARVWMMRNGEGSANARLIAAAPDLFDALEIAEHRLTRLAQDSEVVIDELKLCRAAITKATGDAP